MQVARSQAFKVGTLVASVPAAGGEAFCDGWGGRERGSAGEGWPMVFWGGGGGGHPHPPPRAPHRAPAPLLPFRPAASSSPVTRTSSAARASWRRPVTVSVPSRGTPGESGDAANPREAGWKRGIRVRVCVCARLRWMGTGRGWVCVCERLDLRARVGGAGGRAASPLSSADRRVPFFFSSAHFPNSRGLVVLPLRNAPAKPGASHTHTPPGAPWPCRG